MFPRLAGGRVARSRIGSPTRAWKRAGRMDRDPADRRSAAIISTCRKFWLRSAGRRDRNSMRRRPTIRSSFARSGDTGAESPIRWSPAPIRKALKRAGVDSRHGLAGRRPFDHRAGRERRSRPAFRRTRACSRSRSSTLVSRGGPFHACRSGARVAGNQCAPITPSGRPPCSRAMASRTRSSAFTRRPIATPR